MKYLQASAGIFWTSWRVLETARHTPCVEVANSLVFADRRTNLRATKQIIVLLTIQNEYQKMIIDLPNN